ncbi:MAG: FlgD immunoglobulin-like domain containing protein [Bacteroidota bacterium]
MKTYFLTIAVLISIPLLNTAYSQPLEYGDAPEAVIAYPSSGIIGTFPTCIQVGTSFVQHNNFGAQLGPAFDFEIDGNGGLCPTFAPYDNDECYADGDAGLLIPEPYTIVNNQVVTCPNSTGTSLGQTCAIATWGGNVDIDVSNFMPNQTPGIMNVVIDFNQNGVWGDMVTCPTGQVPEHILQNFVVPWGYAGPLSGLMPPAFTIGPNTGYVWARFTISEAPVAINWDGQGVFEDGESEDYLIHIHAPTSDAEYGDAPEGAIAYPSTSLNGAFPTCISVGPPNHYVSHMLEETLYWGPTKDFETDGNAGLCSPFIAPYDNDECYQDNDAGLIIPAPYTIQVSGGSHNVVPCVAGTAGILDSICNMVHWGSELDIHVTNLSAMDALANVLMDFNRNGRWDLDTTMQCSGNTVYEHVLVNFVVPAGYTGQLSALNPPAFQAGPNVGYIWTRFTVSDINVTPDWDGVGSFEMGESEDYLLYLDLTPGLIDYEGYGELLKLKIYPNPTNHSCMIAYALPYAADVSIDIYDIRGRQVANVLQASQMAGEHEINWNGSGSDGHTVGSGIYIVKVSIDNIPVEHAKVLISN